MLRDETLTPLHRGAMRISLFAVLLLTLAAPGSAQDNDSAFRVGRLAVVLPSEFASIIPGGVSVIQEGNSTLRLALFSDSASGRIVTVAAHTGQSWWQRFLYKRGYGASNSTPHEYKRINPDLLPLSSVFGETVGAAFTIASSRHGESGVMVRGCDDEMCYQVTAGGPTVNSGSGLRFARLLSGVTR